jgi:uncharacterized protein (DUF362 family)
MPIDRRKLVIGSSALIVGAAIARPFFRPRFHAIKRRARSRVAILSASEYSEKLEETLMSGLRLFHLDVSGRTVLLKPNLVDYMPGDAINTNPVLVMAAADCFRRLGAERVVIAEGPGHQRDTFLLLSRSGFLDRLQDQKIDFIDLNRDELVRVKLAARYSALDELWLPTTVLASDFLVSMPKLKTHHWSGLSLSMKNMFGLVPGAKYGWPKNILHWHGIQESIIDICATVPIQFVIADGVVAMEGNGPLNGVARHLGKIVLADDPVAADATCARLMGLNPCGVPHIRETGLFLGNDSVGAIEQLAEAVELPSVPFHVVPEFEYLRMHASRTTISEPSPGNKGRS